MEKKIEIFQCLWEFRELLYECHFNHDQTGVLMLQLKI